ncbi:FG-GAP-like repeat-containing protein [Catenuloplanes japonicus]|uniref:FG-GAP-like repeat-containing protein n=1 Tax=Catenuloplanes japonicus TaxID=33876 RepID=UPI000527632E|nr:FG-GAP-like repeat-containing protein [Catenuloplanes japonicus]
MPVPTEELTLSIVNAVTGTALAVGGATPRRWQLTPVPAAKGGKEQDDQAYVIRDVDSGQVLDNPAAADGSIKRSDAADGKLNQQWHVVPVEGEAGLYLIEDAKDRAVLDLDDTRVVLREHDEDAPSQRWRFVPSEPERVSDPVLRFASLQHWNGRRSWRLHPSPALRPAPDAAPSFSDMLLVLDRYGSTTAATGSVKGATGSTEEVTDGANRTYRGQPGWWAEPGTRFLADVTGEGRHDIVALTPDKGAVTSVSRGDGTFEDERVLHGPMPAPDPADRWTLADLTGEGRPDIVVLAADGVRVSRQDETGAFTPEGGMPVLAAFGHKEKAGAWLADRHPRLLADTTGDGRLDIVGFHDDGVWVALQDEKGTFDEPRYVLAEFGVEQGWTTAVEHPRFVIRTTADGPLDLVGYGPQGVVVARGRGDGTFARPVLALNDFGPAQGWTSTKHVRFVADVTGDGTPDLVGFGDQGVWVAHNRGDGRFDQAQLVCGGFGHGEHAGGWRVDRHPRFLADITGDGRVDIVGFGGPGVYVARNLHRRFRTR